MDYLGKIIIAFELHSVNEIEECLDHGIDPNQIHEGEPLIYQLINMYSRGPMFRKCVQAFVDHGLEFEDKALLSVLLNDAISLQEQINADKNILTGKYTFDCTFTPLLGASLLHICAEYNHLACAEVLVKNGMDVNGKAGYDEYGFGGQTPVFHTVNQHANKSIDVLKYLLAQNADLSLTVNGLIWGKGYPWETFIPSVNPVSYAMMGLLRQFQRTEQDIYDVVSLLLKSRYNIEYYPSNVPNQYLNS
jgi:ankyrin repeat protein